MGPAAFIAAQRGYLFLWVPVWLGVGIAVYFSLPVEPSLSARWLIGVGSLVALLLARRASETLGPLLLALSLTGVGLSLAANRTMQVSAPVLDFRYYGPIEGRIIEIDKSLSERVRLTLDRVVLFNTSSDRTPDRVRVSLSGQQGFVNLEPGLTVILTGHLSPPMGPAEPGGFDFRRMAWFESLGAVGYTRNPVLALEPAPSGLSDVWITQLRMSLSNRIQTQMPGQSGAFAAAVLTGDRSGLSRHTLDTMRASNLAHLLAISGLHMGLLTGFVFLVVRFGVAAVPWLALRTDGRKVAACVALVAAAGYLALSGGSVATQRAFVMAAVMLCAVLLDRRALTLRAVALAGVLILVFRPESLLSAGFQMSFAATTALVWVFSAIRDAKIGRAPKWAAPVLGLIISSAVAGLATGPVGAAHFNQVAQYGIVANLFAVPVMGFLVIPMAVLALCLSPLGLSWIGLWFMGLGCQWILGVAETVSTWPDATRAIIAPPGWVLPTIMLGCLWMILVRGGVKWAGLAPMAVAFLAWSEAERPPILISSSGALVGVLHADGRQLNKPRGDGFVARSWLENDGDHREQPESAWMGKGVFTADVGGVTVRQGTAARLRKDGTGCGGADILISPHAAEGDTRDCWVLDAKALKQTGSVALWPGSDGIEAIAANDLAGVRPWTGPSKPDAAKQTLLGNEQESGVFTTLLARLTDQ